MICREMRLSDQDAVIALWKVAGVYREWNDPVRDIEKALEGSHSTILVGELDGAIVASIMCGEDGHRGWFYYVSTHPDPPRQRSRQGHLASRRRLAAGAGHLEGSVADTR
mgnify:CR=1 FL=1